MSAFSSPPAADAARVLRRVQAVSTSDGAGVRLRRVIGGPALPDLDPFLLLDEFGTDRPEDYIAGFPDHPHRGFETVTYMLEGRMRHRDNHGNEGLLVPGAVQWMTAGRGLVHSEMPEQQEGRMRGFQLWVNLPAAQKLCAPQYQEFAPDAIPEVMPAPGVRVKVVAGALPPDAGTATEQEITGPIVQPATAPVYLDVALDAGTVWSHVLPEGHRGFVYVYEGEARVGEGEDARQVPAQTLGVLDGGTRVVLHAEGGPLRALLVAGRPIGEPVARHGPFVMNTREEVMQAFVDFQQGRF